MQDKETKEWEKELRKLELLETNYGFQGRDDSYQIDYEILIDFIESIEQEAERRGYEEGWQDGFRAELENINKKDFVENKHEN